ncbi:CBS domain-containing protein [Sporosalibacterium faouarense]|uniref:CBS domain-containing protein n=1 Tax=Sporosalibacterium faouarense TaxID=516123 RepID=UPI00141D295A|nr:CBS domain-containing protein [Sporosalibacterium faouarense]MTI47610.1 CBS domain-containing protein [Bacillota bacterium]
MLVRKAMLKRNELTLLEDEMTLKHALDVIEGKGFLSLPVTQENEFVGTVSIYDIYRKYYRNIETREQFLNSKINDFVKTDYKTLSPYDPIEDAAIIFAQKDYPFIPVVEEGKFQGIVTQKEIFKSYSDLFDLNNKVGTRVTIQAYEMRGILSKLTKTITDQGANILSLVVNEVETAMNIREIVVKFEGADKEKVINALGKAGFKIQETR